MENKSIISPKARALKPYEPNTKICEIRLDANESCFDLPEGIRADISRAIESVAFNRYPDPAGAALCEKFAALYGLSPENVTAGNGSDELIFLIESALMQKGDKLITFTPDFSMYGFYANICELDNITLQKKNGLEADLEEALNVIRESGARMAIFSNPCNPTGQGITADRMLSFIKNAGCLVVLDEAYMDFWDQGLIKKACELENLIVLKTLSKAYAFAAARVGFAIACKDISDILKRAKSPYNVNSLSQAAGAVLLDNAEYFNKRREEIVALKCSLEKRLEPICKKYGCELFETRTNFVLIKTPRAKSIYDALLEKSIAVRYLKPDTLRVTAGTKSENAAFLAAFEEELKK